jgi:hypothetical protein
MLRTPSLVWLMALGLLAGIPQGDSAADVYFAECKSVRNCWGSCAYSWGDWPSCTPHGRACFVFQGWSGSRHYYACLPTSNSSHVCDPSGGDPVEPPIYCFGYAYFCGCLNPAGTACVQFSPCYCDGPNPIYGTDVVNYYCL